MMDRTIPWIGLVMKLDSLEHLLEYPLPEEYGCRWFRAGDERVWAEIETSAGEFSNPEDGVVGFRRYFPSDEGLDERMLFLTDGGIPFATATAWYGEGDHGPREGRLHWVSVDAAHQRRGLSYPLVSLALDRMRALGHRSAYLTTQTASWPAIKLYRRFGFAPLVREAGELEGWRIVSEKTGIDFMELI